MSEQETKSTEESQIGGNLDAAGSASGAGSIGANASSKKSEEKRKPKKLSQKGQANGDKGDVEAEVDAGTDEPQTPTPQPKMEQQAQSRSKSRQSRGRGSSAPPSDVDSAYRSDVSQKGGRRNRNRNRGKAQAQSQAQTQQQGKGGGGLLGGGGGPLDSVDEVGDTVNGVADGAGDLVNNTVGNAVSKPHEALGGLLKKGGNEGEKEGEDPGENEQLRLRLDLNLDIEVQLKAKIHGDLTLGLLSVPQTRNCANANVLQELVLDHSREVSSTYTTIPNHLYDSYQMQRENWREGSEQSWRCSNTAASLASIRIGPVLLRLCHGVPVWHLFRIARQVHVCNKTMTMITGVELVAYAPRSFQCRSCPQTCRLQKPW
jgi:hypothetical protein